MAFLLKCFGGVASTCSSKQTSTTIEDLCHRFSLSQLRKSTDDFDESRKIGEGPFGVAYRASISINGQLKDVAVKRLRQQSVNSSYGFLLYKNDIIFMCQLQHPNLLSLVGFCDDQNEMIVVHDYAPNGSLYDQLYNKSPRLSWKRRLEISIGVARALHYLHSGTKRTIIHRDIAPVTIMLDENWVPKLTFFGFSIKAPKSPVKPTEFESVQGTVGSRTCLPAPNVPHKSDVYSFGELLLELICENTSFQIISQQEVRDLEGTGNSEGIIDQSLVREMAPKCLKLYMETAESCLREDPNERPDMGEVEVQLEHLLEIQDEADTNHAFLI